MSYYDHPFVSNSDLTRFKYELEGKEFNPPVDAFRFGSLVDGLITEPNKVDMLNWSFDGYSYSEQEFSLALKLRDAFWSDNLCSALARKADFQTEFYRPSLRIQPNGVNGFDLDMRCKTDLNNPYFIMDIKTTTAKNQNQFIQAIYHFDWDRQIACYKKLAGVAHGLIVGLSKTAPGKVFRVPVDTGKKMHKSGEQKFHELAYKYWLHKIYKNESIC